MTALSRGRAFLPFATRVAAVLALAVPAWSIAGAGQPQPVFRSGVHLLRLDVTVVADDGSPVLDLRADDFRVEVDGEPRAVRTLQVLEIGSEAVNGTAPGASARGAVSPHPTGQLSRVTVIAIDTLTLPYSQERALLESVARFVGTMGPTDRTGLLVFPYASGKGRHVDFTSDVSQVQAAIARVTTVGQRPIGDDRLSLPRESSAPDLTVSRTPTRDDLAGASILRDQLTPLVKGLAAVEGPKTLLLVAGALRADYGAIRDFADAAARSRVTVYVVRPAFASTAADTRSNANPSDAAAVEGLHVLAGMTGGATLDAIARAEGVFERLARETSAAYVLGIDPGTRPAATPLTVKVSVSRPGVTVRSPTHVVAPTVESPARDLKAAVGDALRQPRRATSLPIWLSTAVARGERGTELKVVLVADVGEGGIEGDLAWGYEVRQGAKIVADGFDRQRAGEGSAPRVTAPIALPPGEYDLTFAAVAADGRRGSVQHRVSAVLHGGEGLQASDLFVGQAAGGRFVPVVVPATGRGPLTAYVDLYPTASIDWSQVTVVFTLRDASGATLAALREAPTGKDDKVRRALGVFGTGDVPAGPCRVAATVLVGERPVARVEREVPRR